MCRENRGAESSDKRQMIFGNRQIAPPAKRPGDAPNRKLIVNRFPVIGNPVGLFPEPTIKKLARSPCRAEAGRDEPGVAVFHR